MKPTIFETSWLVAARFVDKHHRHLKAPQGHKFSLALIQNEFTHGVIICGRPVSRILQSRNYLEFTRVCTLGLPNGCSMLMAAARKKGRAMGYSKFVTYTHVGQIASSLKADNWKQTGIVKGRHWHGINDNPKIDKVRWEHD